MQVEIAPGHLGQLQEEVPVAAGLLAQGPLRRHVDRLAFGLAAVAGRAHLDAQRAAGAVFRGHLEGEGLAGEGRVAGGGGAEALRGCGKDLGGAHLGADHRMGAHQHALAALHAQVCFPHGHLGGDVALLPTGRAHRPGAIAGQGTHRQPVAAALEHRRDHRAHKLGSRSEPIRRQRLSDRSGGGGSGNSVQGLPVERLQVIEAGVEGGQVHRHHGLTLAAVAGFDRVADAGEGLLARQHAAEGKEAGLHHRVDVGSHARLARHLVGIDLVHRDPLAADLSAQGFRQPLPGASGRERAVEQQHPARLDAGQQVETLHEIPLVAGHKRGPLDQVGGADRPRPEAQMRHRDRARLLGVVNEIALGKEIGALADDLDRGLVGPHRAVGAQAVKHGAHLGPIGDETVFDVIVEG